MADQVGLAMEIDRILPGSGFHLIDPDRAAALALACQIAHLSPFERFLERADALGGPRGVEDQPPKRQQFGPDRRGTGVESRGDRGILKARAPPLGRGAFLELFASVLVIALHSFGVHGRL